MLTALSFDRNVKINNFEMLLYSELLWFQIHKLAGNGPNDVSNELVHV